MKEQQNWFPKHSQEVVEQNGEESRGNFFEYLDLTERQCLRANKIVKAKLITQWHARDQVRSRRCTFCR